MPRKLLLRLLRVEAPPKLALLIALRLRLANEAWLTLLLLFLPRDSLVRALMLLLDFAFLMDDFLDAPLLTEVGEPPSWVLEH